MAATLASGALPFPADAAGATLDSKLPRISLTKNTTQALVKFQDTVLTEKKNIHQSIAFDPINHDLYVSQAIGARKGMECGGKVCEGNLVITRIPADGTARQKMYLYKFGHGISLGIERSSASSPAYVWLEARATQTDQPRISAASKGYGQAVARVKFRETKGSENRLTDTSSGVTVYSSPIPATKSRGHELRNGTYSVSITGKNLLSISYKHQRIKTTTSKATGKSITSYDTPQTRIASFSLKEVLAKGGFAKVISSCKTKAGCSFHKDYALPSIEGVTKGNNARFDNKCGNRRFLQGWAIAGNYLYTLHGAATEARKSSKDSSSCTRPSSYLASWDLTTGKLVERQAVTSYLTLPKGKDSYSLKIPRREPEGLTILRDDSKKKLKLAFGFAASWDTTRKDGSSRSMYLVFKEGQFS